MTQPVSQFPAGITDGNTPLTVAKAAKIAGMSPSAMRRICDKKEIPHYRVGKHRRIRYGDLEQYMRDYGITLTRFRHIHLYMFTEKLVEMVERISTRCLVSNYVFQTASTDFELGVLFQRRVPDLVLINADGRYAANTALLINQIVSMGVRVGCFSLSSNEDILERVADESRVHMIPPGVDFEGHLKTFLESI